MRVLITGGAGFIGSNIADQLLLRGDKVLILDDFTTGLRRNVPDHNNCTLVEGSIVDQALVSSTFEEFNPDIVIHAAASYKDPDAWQQDSLTNVLGTVNVVKAALALPNSRLIYFQTALCYGVDPAKQPVPLDLPIDPANSSYAISKTAAEQYIQISGIDYVSFRLANAYGPRNVSGPLPTFFQRLSQGKGCYVVNTRRDFIFIGDLISCVLPAIDGKGSGTYHISSGADVSIEELYDAVVSSMGIEPKVALEKRERAPEDAFTILLEPTRAQKDFDWCVSTPFADGVAKAIAYYEEYGIAETYTHLSHN